jgi:hypothetical protein
VIAGAWVLLCSLASFVLGIAFGVAAVGVEVGRRLLEGGWLPW